MLGSFVTASRLTPIHQVSLAVLSRAACASMSTTTTTTTRDRGDRYGPWNGPNYPISGVDVSPGSAETLVRRGGITNHHSIGHSLSNISAKNYQSRLMYVEVIMYAASYRFFSQSIFVLFFPLMFLFLS